MEAGNLDGSKGWEFAKTIQVVEAEGTKRIVVKGQPYMSWRVGDEMAERMAIVQLYEWGVVTQEELSEAFGVHVNSVANYVGAFRAQGSEGLRSGMRGPKESWKLIPEVRGKIMWIVCKEGIREYAAIQERLQKQWNMKVGVVSIRQVLVDNGFVEERIKPESPEPRELWSSSANGELALGWGTNSTEPGSSKKQVADEKPGVVGLSLEDKRNRSAYAPAERRYLDQLERGVFSAYAGGLLFASLLERHHFLDLAKEVIQIETHEGYSLEQLCLTLFYFDLFDFRSIENFKTVYPEEFGVLMGRGVSPSIYTLRRFMHRVRELKKGDALIEAFGKEYLKSGLVRWGVLYIDSHFLPYYGMRVITKGWHGVQDKVLKGSYQFLGIDEDFNPLLFLLRPSSDDLLEMIPEMIEKARRWARDLGMEGDDLTVVFDREGYSAEFFRTLNGMQPKVKFMTWAKYMDRWVGDYKEEQLDKRVTIRYEIQDSEEIRYCESSRMMNKYGKIRALVIESGRKNQRSAIYTNDDNGDGERIIQRMCRRWGQETLNKTFKWDHKMDYHPGYLSEELEEQPLVKNPEIKELKRRKAQVVGKLNELRVQFARKAFSATPEDVNWKEVKERNKDLCIEMDSLQAQITLLELEIDKFPKEVRFDEAHDGKELVELDYEKKRFLDCIKVFTYLMEKRMCALLSSYYDDPKDIYSILAMITRRGADLKLERGQLRVRLKGFRNTEVGYAARHLCEDLNQMRPRTLDKFHFPLHYEVAEGEPTKYY